MNRRGVGAVPPGAAALSGEGARFDLFDPMRIAAAVGVLVSHSFFLVGRHEPRLSVGRYSMTLGSLCVGVFFAISGFLIPASWERNPSILAFLRKRIARIWPGLLVCLVITAWVVGPLVTVEPLGHYLNERGTWLYVMKGLGLVRVGYYLPGVFGGNPHPAEVNGALWTLPLEVSAYVGVMIVGLVEGFKRKWVITVAAVCVFVGFQMVIGSSMIRSNGGFVENHVSAMLILGTWFAAGCLVYTWGGILRGRSALACGVVVVASVVVGLPLIFMFACSAFLIWVGSRSSVVARRLTRRGDPSYGIYIYGFLIQQSLVSIGVDYRSPWALFGEAVMLSLGVGYLSWYLIERPAMRLLRPKLGRSVVTGARVG